MEKRLLVCLAALAGLPGGRGRKEAQQQRQRRRAGRHRTPAHAVRERSHVQRTPSTRNASAVKSASARFRLKLCGRLSLKSPMTR